ncbi:MAG TPA: ring-opening amidohydrolase [Reyranella sp.]|nr:ring-opening amidohydrolase [Reyranella sp.]
MARRAKVLRLPTAGPQDTAPLAAAIERGEIDPATIVAIVGKTEGNGCVNDFTRGYATLALKLLLKDQPVAVVMSGGTEGGLSPHILVFCVEETAETATAKRLAIGTGFTRAFKPEEIGRAAQIEETAKAVVAAMKGAAIASPGDVHFVQIKCPLLTKERIEEAAKRGQRTATEDTYHSMALSRGASALGVGLALGEIKQAPEAAICTDWSLYSGVASTSAGVELLRNEIVVLGNAPGWAGDLVIGHGVMKDAIDAEAARRVLSGLGGETVAVLAKAEAAPSGEIRGRRHTMLDDSDIHSTRHARALVGGVLAGAIGDTMLYVSGGAEHQGPAGGGPVAIIARI